MSHYKYTIRDASFWRITIGLGFSSFIIFAYLYAFQSLLPFFKVFFAINSTQASFLISFAMLGLIVGLFILGFLSDRYGRVPIIYFSLFGSVFSMFLMLFTNSFYFILLLRFIQGFAIAGLTASAVAYISEEVDFRNAKIAVGFYISTNAIGGMLGRVVSGYLTEVYSWQTTLYTLSFVGLFIAISVFFILPKSRFFISSTENIKTDLSAFRHHLRNPLLVILFGLGILLQFSFTGLWTYLPFHLEKAPYHLSLQAIGYLFFAYSFGVIGAPLSSSLANRFGLNNVRFVSISILTLGLLLTMSTFLSLIIVGLCLACFGFFTAHSLTATSVSETATHHKGTASSLYFIAYYIGVASGSSLLGPLYENINWFIFVLIVSLIPLLYISVFKYKKINVI